MKLNDKIKAQIDNYFEKVTPEYLFDLAVSKYKFIEVGIEISGNFTSIPTKNFENINSIKENYPISNINQECNYTMAA